MMTTAEELAPASATPVTTTTDMATTAAKEVAKEHLQQSLESLPKASETSDETMETTEAAEATAEVEDEEEEEENEETPAVTLEQVPDLVASATQCFAMGNFEPAVEKFAMAVETLSNHYGQTAPECADTLFLYGKALLANAIAKNALGDSGAAAKKVAEIAEAESKAMAESSTKGKDRFVFEGDAEEEEDACPLAEVDLGDDSDDLELAWESLDLARIIFSKMEGENEKLKLADVYLALGDTSLESENFDQALQDFKEALSIKKSILPEGHRELAEAHYKVGLAFEYSEVLEEALEQVNITIEILKKKIEQLKENMTSDNEVEIKEIEALFPDMEAKLEELKSSLEKQAKEDAAEMEAEEALEKVEAGPVVVNDVSSLVKPKMSANETQSEKKRKADEVEKDADMKKSKTEEEN